MSAQVLAVAQAFKGTLGVAEVVDAYRRAMGLAGVQGRVVAGSDGGDGLLDALGAQVRHRTPHRSTGPLGRPVTVPVGWLDRTTAVVESRLACGLALLAEEERDPRRTTTRGVGSVLQGVVEAGATTVFVGLGGSATMDGGMGMARVWGWEPLGPDGVPLADGGGALASVTALRAGDRPAARIVGLADVTSPLLGPGGAARFAEQKGADPESAVQLARGLERLARAATAWDGPRLAAIPGAGAAGGLGFGIQCFAGGILRHGASWVLDRSGFADALAGADVVLIGEGAFDGTSLAGKLTGVVLERARAVGVPVVLVAPTVHSAPADVTVEQGGGRWDAERLARHAERAIRRALRLPPL